MTALGLMSGTSMDGIDAALLRTDGENLVELGPTAFFPYPAAFRREIEDGLEDRQGDRAGGKIGRAGLPRWSARSRERHAEAVKALIEMAPEDWRKPDIVGFHGQTVLHRPQTGVDRAARRRRAARAGDRHFASSTTCAPTT